MEELIQRVLENQSTVNVWKNNFKSEEWNDANELHFKMYGVRLNQTKNCGCIPDFYKALNSTTPKKIMEKQNRRFVLKDKLIMMHREAKQFSKHSSEEDLIYLLSKHPDKIVDFETYPENWEEIVNAVTMEQKTENQKSFIKAQNDKPAVIVESDLNSVKEKFESMEPIGTATEEATTKPIGTAKPEDVEIVNLSNEDQLTGPRKAELEAMYAKELKALIVSMNLEVPTGNKGVLVQFIIDSENENCNVPQSK